MTHQVVAIAYPGMAAFELGVVVEVFALPRPELEVDWYDFALCSPTGVVGAVGGFEVRTPHGIEALEAADTVVAIGWPNDVIPAPDLVDRLRQAYERGARIVSFCSGAFLLAAAGLLDGRRAATHWRYAGELAARHPRVAVDRDVLYVDEGQVLTSAGTAAAIDLCLHLVRKDHGTEIANSVARRMVVPPHRDGGQAQYVRLPVPGDTSSDGAIHTLLAWMREHLDEPMDLDTLAARTFLSTRSLSRRFREATGTSPGRWLLHQRLDRCRELLETSDETMDRIAALSGLGSAVTMRHHFARALGTSPTAYRRHFRGELLSA